MSHCAYTKHIMKKITLLLVGLIFTISAHANPAEWLTCTTIGDALSSVEIALNEAGRPEAVGVLININELDDSTARYTSVVEAPDFDRMAKKSTYQFIMRSDDTFDYGGAEINAGLIQIDMRNKANITSLMALKNSIYHMTCIRTVY